MTAELISRRTTNEFREFLVDWTLREIEAEFEAAHIDCARKFVPQVSGQRRSFVEQHYHTLDLTKPEDARRLVVAFASIIERAERNLPQIPAREQVERSIAHLKACLAKDGFTYCDGSITAATPTTRIIFEVKHGISEVTRRAIFDELRVGQIAWYGRLSEPDFLSRLYDLSSLPSHDGRFDSMAGDIWQHRENNLDWDADWVFTDGRLDLIGTGDEAFLRFLCEMIHPVVRPDSNEAKTLVAAFNKHLVADGFELVEGKPISGRPTFLAWHRGSGAVTLPDPIHVGDLLSDEYVRELSSKCDSRLASKDLDGAVTVARTLLEAILSELESRLAGSKGKYGGDLPKQFKQVTRLLRMDEQRPDLDDRFKDVIRGLVMVANGLAPLRNKMSDGHAREHKPAPHHARLVVNAAKTVASFLVESYLCQRDKGFLPVSSRTAGAST
jgi:hypothetical protein